MTSTGETLTDTITEVVLTEVRRELAHQGWFQVEASGRHIHLSAPDAMKLFGSDYALVWSKYLSQPGQFVSGQRVTLVGPKGKLEGAVVLGPERAQTQIEISKTDALTLGLHPPCRESGNLEDTPGIRLEYGNAHVDIESGVIIAERHIHMKPATAIAMGLSDGSRVDFVLDSLRPLTFMDVNVRVSDSADDFMHIDYDEANAAGFEAGMFGFICKDCNLSGRRVCMDTEKLIDEVVRRLIQKISEEQAGTTKVVDTVSSATIASPCNKKENKKLLITETQAMGVEQNTKVQYPKGTVITPLAKDAFKQRGVTVEIV